MGKGQVNPVGTFWSAVMMLDHLGENGAATTRQVTHAVCALLSKQAMRQPAD